MSMKMNFNSFKTLYNMWCILYFYKSIINEILLLIKGNPLLWFFICFMSHSTLSKSNQNDFIHNFIIFILVFNPYRAGLFATCNTPGGVAPTPPTRVKTRVGRKLKFGINYLLYIPRWHIKFQVSIWSGWPVRAGPIWTGRVRPDLPFWSRFGP